MFSLTETKIRNVFKFSLVFIGMLIVPNLLLAQSITIKGKVSDQNGALPGVSISIKGSSIGTASDNNGVYALQVPNANSTLVYSFIGYEEQEIEVGNRQIIDVVLAQATQTIDAVVVIGYGTARKRDLTGSIVQVKASEIADRPSTNPLALLQGKVPGVQIINSGRAGQDPEIRIRGTSSINGYKPLYIVDGLFTDNINFLNASDIESMEILKDPSSLAIFGVRGANGVIIISTKRAKMGQTLVNVNASLAIKSVTDKVKLTNASQFKQLYNEQRLNMGIEDAYDYSRWTADTDWQDEIFQNAVVANTNVSISGASDKNKFYLGVGYTSEEGLILHEKLSRITIGAHNEYSVKDYLRFGFQFNGSRTLPTDGKGVGGALSAAPIAPVRGGDLNLFHTMPDFQRAQVWNPLIDVEDRQGTNIAKNYRAVGNVYGEVDFLKFFNFKATFSLDYQGNNSRRYSPLIYVFNPDVISKSNPKGTEQLVEQSSVSQSKTYALGAQSDYVLSFKHTINRHSVNAIAAFSTTYYETEGLSADRMQSKDGYPIPNDPNKWFVSFGDKATANNGSNQQNRFTMSYLARGMYAYSNKYLLNASFRRDGSSAFYRTGNTWQNFYSFGGGWVASEENFMKGQNVISFLKLKGSWGVLGSQNTGGNYYPAYPLLSNQGSAVFGETIIVGQNREYIPDPNLHWEKTESWEVGIEMTLFANRLRLEPTYYTRTTKDLLTKYTGISGSTPGLQNVGEIENKGFELNTNWNDKLGDFNYSLGFNLTTINNKVKSLVHDNFELVQGISRTLVNHPIAYFYGYEVEGIYQNYKDVFDSPVNTINKVRPGDLKYRDIDGDGKITDKDRTQIGNPTPDFTYGFNLNLSYKGFDFDVDMMGVYGNEVYRSWGKSTYAQLNYLEDRMNRWHGEGTSNWEPILDPSRSNNHLPSSYYVEDGSFFRIRNVQLGYTFNPALLSKIYIQSFRLFANVQNLKTWKKNSGYTPEIGGGALEFGVDNGGYPVPTIYSFGINLTF